MARPLRARPRPPSACRPSWSTSTRRGWLRPVPARRPTRTPTPTPTPTDGVRSSRAFLDGRTRRTPGIGPPRPARSRCRPSSTGPTSKRWRPWSTRTSRPSSESSVGPTSRWPSWASPPASHIWSACPRPSPAYPGGRPPGPQSQPGRWPSPVASPASTRRPPRAAGRSSDGRHCGCSTRRPPRSPVSGPATASA